MPHFDTLKIYTCSYGKHCKKRRNCLLQAISAFLTMFSTPYGTSFSFQMHLHMSSAICLDQPKILSSGNGLTVSPHDTQVISVKRELNDFENSIDSCQLARTAQADISRNFSLSFFLILSI